MRYTAAAITYVIHVFACLIQAKTPRYIATPVNCVSLINTYVRFQAGGRFSSIVGFGIS